MPINWIILLTIVFWLLLYYDIKNFTHQKTHISDIYGSISDTYLGGGSERGGCPPNGLKEAPWARWLEGAPWRWLEGAPCTTDSCCCCCCRARCRALLSRKDRHYRTQGPQRKSIWARGGWSKGFRRTPGGREKSVSKNHSLATKNSAQIQPFPTKISPPSQEFRDATRGDTPEAVARPKTGFAPKI